jgi:hypothetical protein
MFIKPEHPTLKLQSSFAARVISSSAKRTE